MNYIDIKIPLDFVEANILINHLQQHDIDCFLNDSYSATGYYPGTFTARIMVNEKDIEHAKKLIEEFLSKK